jgi:Holliday junction resolvase
LTKFEKGIKINEVLSKNTKMRKEFVWQASLDADETVNDKARKQIKEHGEELERIMGREISSK